jgi:hypothetical protein
MSLSSDNSISNNSNSGSSDSSAVAAFLAAATRGDLPTMRTLAEADPRLSNAHDDEGRTALYLAAARGHGAAAAWLTAEGGARWLPLVGFGSQAPRPRSVIAVLFFERAFFRFVLLLLLFARARLPPLFVCMFF